MLLGINFDFFLSSTFVFPRHVQDPNLRWLSKTTHIPQYMHPSWWPSYFVCMLLLLNIDYNRSRAIDQQQNKEPSINSIEECCNNNWVECNIPHAISWINLNVVTVWILYCNKSIVIFLENLSKWFCCIFIFKMHKRKCDKVFCCIKLPSKNHNQRKKCTYHIRSKVRHIMSRLTYRIIDRPHFSTWPYNWITHFATMGYTITDPTTICDLYNITLGSKN